MNEGSISRNSWQSVQITFAGLIDDHFAFVHAEGQEAYVADAKSGLCAFASIADLDLATTRIEPPAF